MSPAEELTKLLEKAGRSRKWLVEKTGNTATTVRQYLNGSKESRRFHEKAKGILQEDLASRKPKAKPPLQWDLLFETEEQFRKVDRASRLVGATDIVEFCRAVLLDRAEKIFEEKKLGIYPKAPATKGLKVAEEDL